MHKANEKQREAIKQTTSPCLVIAGAGSGKTKVITEKIAYLINQEQYHPTSIFALTFTNKAAQEMNHRIKKTISHKDNIWISTFHTLGLHIIKSEARALNINRNFSLFDQNDSEKLIKELVDPKIKTQKDKINAIKNTISHWKNSLVDAETAIQTAKHHQKYTALIYKEYDKHLRSYNALDFDDLILMPTKLLLENETIRHKWNNKVKYLLVDEYQDTNTIQYQLIKLIIGIRNKFTVVGDDDQSIYSWRGADPKNLTKITEDFPNIKVIKLEQNYRSTNNILQIANKLIAHNDHIFNKNLFSNLGAGEKVKVIETENEEQEANRVISEIHRHKVLQNYNYGDYAILYRSNHQARIIEKTLITKRIPYVISGDISFFDRVEIKDIMAYFKLIINPDDDKAFIRAVNTPKRGIGSSTLMKIGEAAQEWKCSIFEAACDSRLKHILNSSTFFKVESFIKMIVNIQDKVKRADPTASVNLLREQIQYEKYLAEHAASPKKLEMAQKNVNELFDWIKKMINPDSADSISIHEAINRIMLKSMLDKQEDANSNNKINLMTLHSTKGLEFNNVYIVGFEEGLLPHQNSIDSNQIQEERRLAYVGMTRARRNLTITFCKTRSNFQTINRVMKSRFLDELIQENIDWEIADQQVTQTQRHQSARDHIAKLKNLL